MVTAAQPQVTPLHTRQKTVRLLHLHGLRDETRPCRREAANMVPLTPSDIGNALRVGNLRVLLLFIPVVGVHRHEKKQKIATMASPLDLCTSYPARRWCQHHDR